MAHRTIALALLAALYLTGARAADPGGSFAVKGQGLTTCADFVKAVKDRDMEKIAGYVGWVSGFITASNQHTPQTFDLTPWQNVRTLTAALANYCDNNADTRFAAAAVRLGASLHRDRLSERSDLVSIEHGGATHYVYRETLRRAQAALSEKGLYSGSLDGEFGKATRAALEKFQANANLPVNGLPDQRTLLGLFLVTSE